MEHIKNTTELLGMKYPNIEIFDFYNYQTHIEIQAKIEATNKLIKDIKRQAFGFRIFKNFKTKILITQNIQKERTTFVLSRT